MEIELLAPARDLEHGRAAIECGSDALYIGGVGFSARQAAHNKIEDIALLAEYAHSYGVRLYVAMNTILMDSELADAEAMAREVISAGADALIVQDMAYATMGLDVALHASTQMSLDSLERAKHLEACGFSRIILERGLSLEEISAIGSSTEVEIEAFVHGAICVSTSGKCYMGHIVSSRGGNRGGCSQPCRSKFDLEDGSGKIIMRDRHLLSLRDLNLSEHIYDMAEAGVRSFKIEGRLKDMAYLKNSVAYYNQKLDELVALGRGYRRASHGSSQAGFTPRPEATFSRGFTTYNLLARTKGVASLDTGKAVGAYIGKVAKLSKSGFTLSDITSELSAGDGVVLYDSDGSMAATNINGASGREVVPNKMAGIKTGMSLYRNFDKAAVDKILSSKTRRAVEVEISAQFSESSITIEASDSYGSSASISRTISWESPSNPEKFITTLKTQLSKSGDTIFLVRSVTIVGEPSFLPISEINRVRRELLEKLENSRKEHYRRPEPSKMVAAPLSGELSYKYNVVNSASRLFYQDAGVTAVEDGIELRSSFEGIDAMTSSYCIRREIGECLKEGGRRGDLYLRNGAHRFKLEFDCSECKMRVVYKEKIR